MKTGIQALLFCLFLSSSLSHSMDDQSQYTFEWISGAFLVGLIIYCASNYSKKAALRKQRQETQKLLTHINSYNESDGDQEIFSSTIARLINQGANPNKKLEHNPLKDIQNISAGQLAIKKNVPPSVIQKLIAYGADFNEDDLQNATELGYKDIAKLLNIWIHIKPRPVEDQNVDLSQEIKKGYIREGNDAYLVGFHENKLMERLERAQTPPMQGDTNQKIIRKTASTPIVIPNPISANLGDGYSIDLEALTSKASSSANPSSSSSDSTEQLLTPN